jgi:transglutaminase-like putative cysteine protease
MKKYFSIIFFVLCVSFPVQAASPARRDILFTYRVILKDIPKDVSEIKIWIPYPAENNYQEVSAVFVQQEGLLSLSREEKYGNKILYYHLSPPFGQPIEIKQTYRITRYEFSTDTRSKAYKTKEAGASPKKYLKPSKFVKATPEVKMIAKDIMRDAHARRERPRAIYNYIWKNYAYDKTVPGWGSGDVERFCRFKSGNCVDFHSLFIALARIMGIPAKYVIGFPLPKEREGMVQSYHCWLEFYDPAFGWAPVDISEAWKDKTKFNYNFGSVDQNRIEFTHGRDIVLAPPQSGEELNYFIYPYVEVDGKTFNAFESSCEFKDIG